MSKVNLRKQSNFIASVFSKDISEIKANEGKPRIRVNNIAWPSEAMSDLGPVSIGACKRSVFYKILGCSETEPMSVRGRHICDAGIMYEDHHIERFKSMGMFDSDQLPIKFVMPNTANKVEVSGRMDCVIKHGGKLKGIEMKSVGGYKASKVMGDQRTLPVPAANNLMQAMLYKYYLSEIPEGIEHGIEEVYLMYINRSDNCVFYYKVDIGMHGYPILTAIDEAGRQVYVMDLSEQESFEDLLSTTTPSPSEKARIAECRINIYDIFSKFDLTYTYARQEMLPDADYKFVYTMDEVEREFRCGRMSKVKYNKAKKGEPYGDAQCAWCSFKTKCMADSGITLA